MILLNFISFVIVLILGPLSYSHSGSNSISSPNPYPSVCERVLRAHPIFKDIEGPYLSNERVQELLLSSSFTSSDFKNFAKRPTLLTGSVSSGKSHITRQLVRNLIASNKRFLYIGDPIPKKYFDDNMFASPDGAVPSLGNGPNLIWASNDKPVSDYLLEHAKLLENVLINDPVTFRGIELFELFELFLNTGDFLIGGYLILDLPPSLFYARAIPALNDLNRMTQRNLNPGFIHSILIEVGQALSQKGVKLVITVPTQIIARFKSDHSYIPILDRVSVLNLDQIHRE